MNWVITLVQIEYMLIEYMFVRFLAETALNVMVYVYKYIDYIYIYKFVKMWTVLK